MRFTDRYQQRKKEDNPDVSVFPHAQSNKLQQTTVKLTIESFTPEPEQPFPRTVHRIIFKKLF
jgi:hypothetical protein